MTFERKWQDNVLLNKTISEVFGFPFRLGHDFDGIDFFQLHKELIALGLRSNMNFIESGEWFEFHHYNNNESIPEK